jgi:hypothetical protein
MPIGAITMTRTRIATMNRWEYLSVLSLALFILIASIYIDRLAERMDRSEARQNLQTMRFEEIEKFIGLKR